MFGRQSSLSSLYCVVLSMLMAQPLVQVVPVDHCKGCTVLGRLNTPPAAAIIAATLKTWLHVMQLHGHAFNANGLHTTMWL